MIRRILIIDDSKLSRLTHTLMLRHSVEEGVEMIEAENGVEGLEQIHRYHDVDLIFLDIRMPGMDGVTFVQHLYANPLCKGIPVVVITSDPNGREAQMLRNFGITKILGKPAQREQVAQIVAEVRQGQQNERGVML